MVAIPKGCDVRVGRPVPDEDLIPFRWDVQDGHPYEAATSNYSGSGSSEPLTVACAADDQITWRYCRC